MLSFASRLPFLSAAALIAAAVGDPLVETIANSGAFGRGYDDGSNLSVVPTLVAGTLLVLLAAAVRCRALLPRSLSPRRADWFEDGAQHFAGASPWRDVPLVFVMQIAAVFTMESAEQLALGGRLAGGLVWLGGPVAFSLATHAAIGALCTLLCAALVRAMLRTFGSLIRGAFEAIVLSIARNPAVHGARDDREARPRIEAPHIRQLGGRAPPRLPLAA